MLYENVTLSNLIDFLKSRGKISGFNLFTFNSNISRVFNKSELYPASKTKDKYILWILGNNLCKPRTNPPRKIINDIDWVDSLIVNRLTKTIIKSSSRIFLH